MNTPCVHETPPRTTPAGFRAVSEPVQADERSLRSQLSELAYEDSTCRRAKSGLSAISRCLTAKPLVGRAGCPRGGVRGRCGNVISPGSNSPLGPLARCPLLLRLLRPETPYPVQVVSGQRKAKEHGHLDLAEDAEEPAAEVDERPFEGRVRRFDDLASTHGDSPCRGAIRNALGEGQLDRGGGKDPGAATVHAVGELHQRSAA